MILSTSDHFGISLLYTRPLNAFLLQVKFKTAEIAARFKKTFEESVDKANRAKTSTTPQKDGDAQKVPSSFGDKFKPAAGSWECAACMVRNDAAATTCDACKTAKPNTTQKQLT